MRYGTKAIREEEIVKILVEDDPPGEIITLRKKLLRYTKSLTDTDKDKYESDMFYIQRKEEKVQGRDKRVGKQYLQEQKKKELERLKAKKDHKIKN